MTSDFPYLGPALQKNPYISYLIFAHFQCQSIAFCTMTPHWFSLNWVLTLFLLHKLYIVFDQQHASFKSFTHPHIILHTNFKWMFCTTVNHEETNKMAPLFISVHCLHDRYRHCHRSIQWLTCCGLVLSFVFMTGGPTKF